MKPPDRQEEQVPKQQRADDGAGLAQRPALEVADDCKVEGDIREEGRQVHQGVDGDQRPGDPMASVGLHDVKKHRQYSRTHGIAIDGHRHAQPIVRGCEGQPVVKIVLEHQAEHERDDDDHIPLAVPVQIGVQPYRQQQPDQQHGCGQDRHPGHELPDDRDLLDPGLSVCPYDGQRSVIGNIALVRGAVFKYDAFVHGQARLRLVEDAAALHKRGIAGHAAAHQDHRAVVGNAAAGVQRGIAGYAAALHDQGAPVHYAAAVVVIAAGDEARAHAVPKGQARAGLDVDGGPRVFVPLHAISIQRMPVQVQRQALAGGNVEGGLRFQRRQVAGQDDDRPALRPIDGLLERRPAVDAGIRPRRDGEKQRRQ